MAGEVDKCSRGPTALCSSGLSTSTPLSPHSGLSRGPHRRPSMLLPMALSGLSNPHVTCSALACDGGLGDLGCPCRSVFLEGGVATVSDCIQCPYRSFSWCLKRNGGKKKAVETMPSSHPLAMCPQIRPSLCLGFLITHGTSLPLQLQHAQALSIKVT